LTTVIEDNKSLTDQKRKNIAASADETLEKLQNEAVVTLKNQLYFTTQEKETLDKLWRSSQATVVGLEHEIREYRHSNKVCGTVLSH
jgi:sulfite reductase beta subunit-like hemoprotein